MFMTTQGFPDNDALEIPCNHSDLVMDQLCEEFVMGLVGIYSLVEIRNAMRQCTILAVPIIYTPMTSRGSSMQ